MRIFRSVLTAAVVVALCASSVGAQSRTETITVSSTAIGLTVATILTPTFGTQVTACVFTVASNDIRLRYDGVDPTASVGHLYSDPAAFQMSGTAELRALRMIRVTSDATVTVTCSYGAMEPALRASSGVGGAESAAYDSTADALKALLVDASGNALTLAEDAVVGDPAPAGGPLSVCRYAEFDGAAVTAQADVEGDATACITSKEGVQMVMVVSEDGALERGTATTPYVVSSVEAAGAALTALQLIDNAETAASHYAYTSAGATEDEHVVVAAPAVLWSVTATNTAAAVAYLRCENQDELGDGAPGTDTLAAATDLDLGIPGATTGAGITFSFARGLAFTVGIKCWLVTGEAYSDVAEVGANDVKLLYSYK